MSKDRQPLSLSLSKQMKEMRHYKSEPLLLRRKVVSSILIAFVVSLGLICVYYGTTFALPLRLSDVDDANDPSFLTFSSSTSLSDNDDDDDLDGKRNGSAFDSFEDQLHHISDPPKTIPVCDSRLSELIPCLDRNIIYQLKLKLNLSLMEHYERHCPPQEHRYNCLIPPPIGYKVPIRWPASRDEVWKVNVPHTHLASEKSDQNWMVVNGDKINFPGGGTHFHTGANKYVTALAKVTNDAILDSHFLCTASSVGNDRTHSIHSNHSILLFKQMLKFSNDNLNNGGNIRNVLDVGCGVASFGAHLLSLNIIAMSLAPNDVHENQIQFALERGIPSTLGVLGTMRLPYPSRSFELVHCSRCRIDWLQRDGILLLELDRLLRPGGYFVYSSPEAYAQDPKNRRIWSALSDLLGRMCWRIASKRDQTVIWTKPSCNSCYLKRDPRTQPPLCSSGEDPDAAWSVPMKACITPYSKMMHRTKGSGLVPWPQRLTTPPPRLEELGINVEIYRKDTEIWHWRVIEYWKQMKYKIEKNSFRNIMDMNSNLGSFAASLKDKDVWVMNVVPVNESSKLKIIYDRGLIGTVHDWCESFSTYPRTYDLLHAWSVFSEIEKRGCSIEDLLIEMDRMLRPNGFVILRDKYYVVNYIRKFMMALHWDGWSSEVEPKVDALSLGEERVLIARKRLWEEGEAKTL